jgi:hypothetical protein
MILSTTALLMAGPSTAQAGTGDIWRACGGWMSSNGSTKGTHFKVSTLKQYKKRCRTYRRLARDIAFDPTNVPRRIKGFRLQGSDESPLIYRRGREQIIVVITED